MKNQAEDLLNIIAQIIYDKKGFNILALDVKELSNLTDYFLIAEGNVERHVQSLSRDVVSVIQSLNLPLYHIDGNRIGDWVVVDCGLILVHLFTPEMREKYALEQLWNKGKIVDLKLKLDQTPQP